MTVTSPEDPLALPLAAFTRDVTVNVTSAFVAAQQAALGFAKLPDSASKTFVYTGNIMNVAVIPSLFDQGVGKSGGAHMVWVAATAYKDRGFKSVFSFLLFFSLSKMLNCYRFYYADERKADGSAKYRVDGEAHAKLFWGLAQAKSQGPWLQSFVKDVGYKDFGPYGL